MMKKLTISGGSHPYIYEDLTHSHAATTWAHIYPGVRADAAQSPTCTDVWPQWPNKVLHIFPNSSFMKIIQCLKILRTNIDNWYEKHLNPWPHNFNLVIAKRENLQFLWRKQTASSIIMDTISVFRTCCSSTILILAIKNIIFTLKQICPTGGSIVSPLN